MSLRNRARSLQKKTGLSYQQALARLRALGERPARLSQKTGWPLEVCDRYFVDGHAPIAVVDARRRGAEAIEAVCETLRASANARAALVAEGGRIVACAGEQPESARLVFRMLSLPPRAAGTRPPEPPEVWQAERGEAVYQTRVKRALLAVRFHRDETSLGLVRLRARKAAEELERLLDDDEVTGMPPAGGDGGPSGAPNELRVVEPVAAERPRPRPTPIGRKKRSG